MPDIEFQSDAIQVDAALIGRGLGLDPQTLPALLRSGAVTSRCERGVGEDEGRYRLSFFYGGRRLRIVTDVTGRVLQCSSVDFGDRPLPNSLRKPGP